MALGCSNCCLADRWACPRTNKTMDLDPVGANTRWSSIFKLSPPPLRPASAILMKYHKAPDPITHSSGPRLRLTGAGEGRNACSLLCANHPLSPNATRHPHLKREHKTTEQILTRARSTPHPPAPTPDPPLRAEGSRGPVLPETQAKSSQNAPVSSGLHLSLPNR